MVPPTAVISGMLAGKLTASPLVACALENDASQPAAPLSPEAASQVMLARWPAVRWSGMRES